MLTIIAFVLLFLSLKSQRWWKVWMAMASAITFFALAPNYAVIEIPAENTGGDINVVNTNATNSTFDSSPDTPLTFEKYFDAWVFAYIFFGIGLLMLIRTVYLTVQFRRLDAEEQAEEEKEIELHRDI